ncbi:MAG: glycosyltransferase [Actinomycetota bacterium]|nr:glycosyltransferase [Actinomycetota bacterium]
MRVLQLHSRYREPGGEDRVAEAEAALLRSAGHRVVQHWAENPTGAVASAKVLLRSASNPTAARAVRNLVRHDRPDVAHVHNTWFALSSSVVTALKEAGVPVVSTLHNYRLMCLNSMLFREGRPCMDCVGTAPLPGIVHACYRGSRALSAVAAGVIVSDRHRRTWEEGVDLFLVPTEFAGRLFEQSGLPPDRVRVKPHFTTDPGPREDPPSASREVLFVGRLAPGKGLEVLLSAWSRLPDTSLRLTVIGDGPLRAELSRRAAPGVRFLGRLPGVEVRRRMLEARALVFPSTWYEPFGMVLIEAMAAGLPVIGSDVGDAIAIVAPAVPGLLARPGDAAALVEAIHMLEDDETVEVAGSAARGRYEANFTPAVNLPLLQAAYYSVIGPSGSRSLYP